MILFFIFLWALFNDHGWVAFFLLMDAFRTRITTMQTEPHEITSLKTCIRELIKAGTPMSAWINPDHRNRIAWEEAKAKALDLLSDEETQKP